MQYETKILTTKYQKPDAYGALSMPVYYTAAFEFESAKAMGDAFCGRSMAPSYARIANPTTTYLEERVRQFTGATSVTALNTGMTAIHYALTAVSAAGLNSRALSISRNLMRWRRRSMTRPVRCFSRSSPIRNSSWLTSGS